MTWQAAAATSPQERIIIALDVPALEDALALVRELSPHAGLFKVGLQLYTAGGPEVVRAIRAAGGRIFLDLKLHDIPNTVNRTIEGAQSLGVEMMTIHLSGGREMIAAAVQARRPEMLLLGVTILTSTNDAMLREVGVDSPLEKQVLRLAKLGVDTGIGGLVASAREVQPLRQAHGNAIKIITPGIRPAGSLPNDQKRAMTPAAALRAGADYLVIGRPITMAKDPRATLAQIVAELAR